MWNLLICDDDPSDILMIESSVEKFVRESGEEINISSCHSGFELFRLEYSKADIILLDIKMQGINGMEVAKRLRSENNHAVLIFISSMIQFAIEGYSVHAFSFIKKPVQYNQFRFVMFDAIRSLRNNKGKAILVENNEKDSIVLNSLDISYFEAYGHTVYACMPDNRKETINLTLTQLQDRLGSDFFRCHKSYIVNFRYIEKVTERDIILNTGVVLPLSRHRHQEFIQKLGEFCGRL